MRTIISNSFGRRQTGRYHEPAATLSGGKDAMLAISRFRVPEADTPSFLASARAAASFFGGCAGCSGADLLRNLDDPELWTLTTRWVNVGAYRRAFNGNQAKLVLVPLLSRAIDEPGAYAEPDEVGENRPRGAIP